MTPTMWKHKLIRQFQRQRIDHRIIAAFDSVPMEDFVAEQYRDLVYGDKPIPLGYDRHTPTALDAMNLVTSINPSPDDRVLQVMTGSGYVATLLGRLCAEVYTAEEDDRLRELAAERIARYVSNVHIVQPENFGYPSAAPYDKAIVMDAIPEQSREPYERYLISQMRTTGTILFPVDYGTAKKIVRRSLPNLERISGIAHLDTLKIKK